ncbi:HAMP domain-containing sensor histidine kinase [Marinobacter sp. M216]|uniref:histidine kinase n=1 Tax=Marinobacter albus TaxID=3030833 RepID=A0ABT7H7T0_9GAMM|nr:HAMP domain-containing sensor histidine kinase [Marinobacter sp. M216]MDK9556410.1 HAMP domain-containing sensor histidine kinase [Marinobacter sp. M216]
MDTQTIRLQQSAGFRRLRFSPDLEPGYRQLRAAAVRERARLVSAAGLLIFGIFVLLDLVMLPPELAKTTTAIRLWVTCPVITLVWWLSYCQRPGDLGFEGLYALAYLIGGLSVVAIIATARLRDFPLPYEGMLLMLMFGYFAMGLPFFAASIASAIIIVAYLIVELSVGLPPGAVMVNLFFVLTANTIGMMGAWLSEYRHRAHFLDQQLVNFLHQSAAEESERKSHLITVASHDLRQPLNIIGLTLENLSAARLAPEHLSLVRRLQGTVSHFQRLLGTVLDISRINEGMIQPQNDVMDLNALLDQLVDLTVDHATLHDIRLCRATPEPRLQVMADPELLLRALQNLVFNAIDHSGGNEVRITVAPRGAIVRVSISDNGTGLDKQLQDSVFQPFVRGAQGRDNPAGLGLGLAIVRELTGMIGGSCGVTSEPGAGSTFWIDVRLAADAPALAACDPPHADTPVTASPSGGPD